MPANKPRKGPTAATAGGTPVGIGGNGTAPFFETSASIRGSTRSASVSRPLLASQRGDSGSTRIREGVGGTGTPPRMNADCQPKLGITKEPTRPAVVKPTGNIICCITTKPPRPLDLANALT